LTSNRNAHWVSFVAKILGLIAVLSLIALCILWVFRTLYLFTLILTYEALFILIAGVFQILGSYIYREDSIPYSRGFRTGWIDFRKFAKLKPKERQRYRQEGTIMVIIGLILCATTIIVHFSIPY